MNRQVRKALNERRREAEQAAAGSDEDSDDVVPQPAKKSAFAMLMDDENESEPEPEVASEPEEPAEKPKKKRGGKKKSKSKKASVEEDEVKVDAQQSVEPDVDSILDKAIEQNKKSEMIHVEAGSTIDPNQSLRRKGHELLICEPRLFDADLELSRMFGANVVRAARAPEEAPRQRERQSRSSTSRPAAASRHSTVLVRQPQHWQGGNGDIRMEIESKSSSHSASTTASTNSVPMQSGSGLLGRLASSLSGSAASAAAPAVSAQYVDDRQDGTWFVLKYSADYEREQRSYQACAAGFDPQSIAYFLQAHPFHVDALMQMSEIYKQHGEFATASELLQRAIYRLETCFHARFTPWTNADCRLSYSHPTNRCIYLALYRHIQFLGRKGACRAALEFSKLLLSFAPDTDPMCVLLLIDHHAIRAKEYKWLVEFVSEFQQSYQTSNGTKIEQKASMLPNLSYSAALGQFHESNGASEIACVAIANDMSLAELNPGERASALLQRALLLYPELLEPLIQACNATSAKWDPIFGDDYFSDANRRRERTVALEKLIKIYTDKNAILWKAPQVLDWLFLNAQAVVARVHSGEVDLDAFRHSRELLFDPSSPNKYSRIIVSDYADLVTALPAEELAGHLPDLRHADPRAIPAHVRMMIAQMEQQQMAQQNQLDAQQALQQRNPFAVFLQSLLPWMNFAEVGQVPPQLQDFDSSDYDSEHDDIDHDHEFN